MAAAGVDLGERGGPAGLQGRRSALRRQQRQGQQRQRRGPPAPHPALLRVLPVLPRAALRSASGSVKAPKCRRRRPPFIRSRARRERSPRAWRLLTGPLPAPPVPAGGAEAVPAPGAALGGGRSLSRLPLQHGRVPQVPAPFAGGRCWGRPGAPRGGAAGSARAPGAPWRAGTAAQGTREPQGDEVTPDLRDRFGSAALGAKGLAAPHRTEQKISCKELILISSTTQISCHKSQ